MTRPTSRDVATAAGVSQATVSLVLGDKWRGRVSERTAGLVREAATTLGYRPNLAARNLRLGSTRTALLVVPALTNEFFARVYTGAARIAAEHGFGVVLYPSPDGTGPARDPFASASAALDGVIASSMAAHALDAIGDAALPLVMLDSDPTAGRAAAHVNLAMADGMRQTTEHLLTLGHRRFLHLASAVDSWTFDIRAEAIAALLEPHAELRTVRAPSPSPTPARPWKPPWQPPRADPPPSSATTTSWPPAPAKPPAASACASPKTFPSPASTTSPSPPPSNPSSPPSTCPPNASANRAWPPSSPSSKAPPGPPPTSRST